MKKTYKVVCSWEVYATSEVEAKNLEDAIEIVEADEFPLPTDTAYVDGTFKVDVDVTELLASKDK